MHRHLALVLIVALSGASRAQNPHDEGILAGRSAQPLLRLCVFELQANTAHGVAEQKIRIERGKAKCG